ncbi:hypothetical protein [Sphingosinicella sp. CPCC 101087]|uniref:hypothetical protein n=1 Tax=Sphingosinicella sp. CPCC 101087 TaxID=2497754 RepID=UPI0013EC58B0|nr:hypothetical protein [Sphingosinicella sp. CPCC 101087]
MSNAAAELEPGKDFVHDQRAVYLAHILRRLPERLRNQASSDGACSRESPPTEE